MLGFLINFEHGLHKVASQISLKRHFDGLPTRPSVDGPRAPHGLQTAQGHPFTCHVRGHVGIPAACGWNSRVWRAKQMRHAHGLSAAAPCRARHHIPTDRPATYRTPWETRRRCVHCVHPFLPSANKVRGRTNGPLSDAWDEDWRRAFNNRGHDSW